MTEPPRFTFEGIDRSIATDRLTDLLDAIVDHASLQRALTMQFRDRLLYGTGGAVNRVLDPSGVYRFEYVPPPTWPWEPAVWCGTLRSVLAEEAFGRARHP